MIIIDLCVNLHFCEVWIKTFFFIRRKKFLQNNARLPADFKWEALWKNELSGRC